MENIKVTLFVRFGGFRILKFVLAYFLKKVEKRNSKKFKRRVVFTNDSLGRNINLFGVYEKEELEILVKFLNEKLPDFNFGTFVDVGANIGNHTIFFSHYFKKIYCFEPHPLVHKVLEINVGNIATKCFQLALGDKTEKLELKESAFNVGNNTLLEPGGEYKSYTVQVEPLDALELGVIDLIKIDVEGFESNVLRGAVNSIKMYKPIILFEQNRDDFYDGKSEVIDQVLEMGYDVHWIKNNFPRTPVSIQRVGYALTCFLFGKKLTIQTGKYPPTKSHPFLIAVPK